MSAREKIRAEWRGLTRPEKVRASLVLLVVVLGIAGGLVLGCMAGAYLHLIGVL